MITHELAKKLNDAGFPQKEDKDYPVFWFLSTGALFLDSHQKAPKGAVYIPTLSELIEACGSDFDSLRLNRHFPKWKKWVAFSFKLASTLISVDPPSAAGLGGFEGDTAEEAVANLWIELNKK